MKISRQVLNKYFAVEKKILHHVLHKCSTALAYQITQYLHFHINFQFASFQKLKNNCRFNIYICTKLELKAASDSQSRGSIDINLIQFDGQIRPDPSDVKILNATFFISDLFSPFSWSWPAKLQFCRLDRVTHHPPPPPHPFSSLLSFWPPSPQLAAALTSPPPTVRTGVWKSQRYRRSLSQFCEARCSSTWTPPLHSGNSRDALTMARRAGGGGRLEAARPVAAATTWSWERGSYLPPLPPPHQHHHHRLYQSRKRAAAQSTKVRPTATSHGQQNNWYWIEFLVSAVASYLPPLPPCHRKLSTM